jgi:hypothetical protein
MEADYIDKDCCHYCADAVKFVSSGMSPTTISIKNAHYYTWYDADGDSELDSNEAIYLVNFIDSTADGILDTREYYRVMDTDGDDIVEDKELFLSYEDFPWFRDKTIKDITKVELFGEGHLYWENLDVDLSIEMIEHPERFPLQAHVA